MCAKCVTVVGLLGFYDYARRKARSYAWDTDEQGAECWAAAGDLLCELELSSETEVQPADRDHNHAPR